MVLNREESTRAREDRRKADQRRHESSREHAMNGRKMGDDSRMQIRKWDGVEGREADADRIDSLAGEKSHHVHDGGRRDKKDRNRSSSHHDTVSLVICFSGNAVFSCCVWEINEYLHVW